MRYKSAALLAAEISVLMLAACTDDTSVAILKLDSHDIRALIESTPVPVEIQSYSMNEIMKEEQVKESVKSTVSLKNRRRNRQHSISLSQWPGM